MKQHISLSSVIHDRKAFLFAIGPLAYVLSAEDANKSTELSPHLTLGPTPADPSTFHHMPTKQSLSTLALSSHSTHDVSHMIPLSDRQERILNFHLRHVRSSLGVSSSSVHTSASSRGSSVIGPPISTAPPISDHSLGTIAASPQWIVSDFTPSEADDALHLISTANASADPAQNAPSDNVKSEVIDDLEEGQFSKTSHATHLSNSHGQVNANHDSNDGEYSHSDDKSSDGVHDLETELKNDGSYWPFYEYEGNEQEQEQEQEEEEEEIFSQALPQEEEEGEDEDELSAQTTRLSLKAPETSRSLHRQPDRSDRILTAQHPYTTEEEVSSDASHTAESRKPKRKQRAVDNADERAEHRGHKRPRREESLAVKLAREWGDVIRDYLHMVEGRSTRLLRTHEGEEYGQQKMLLMLKWAIGEVEAARNNIAPSVLKVRACRHFAWRRARC